MALNFNGEHSSFTSKGKKYHNICALYKNHFLLTIEYSFDKVTFSDLSSWLTDLMYARPIFPSDYLNINQVEQHST